MERRTLGISLSQTIKHDEIQRYGTQITDIIQRIASLQQQWFVLEEQIITDEPREIVGMRRPQKKWLDDIKRHFGRQ